MRGVNPRKAPLCTKQQTQADRIDLPESVMPTVSNFPSTSPTTCADAALKGANGVVKMVEGRRLGTKRAAHVRTASMRMDMCSEVR